MRFSFLAAAAAVAFFANHVLAIDSDTTTSVSPARARRAARSLNTGIKPRQDDGGGDDAQENCIYSGPGVLFDATTGICSCPSGDCSCPSGSQSDGNGSCTCSDMTATYNYSSNACDCPANTFFSGNGCTDCGSNMGSPSGSTSNDQCSCIPGSTNYSADYNECSCTGDNYYEFGMDYVCTICPDNITIDPTPSSINFGTCQCPGIEEFDAITGTCYCTAPGGACQCLPGSTVVYADQAILGASCVCDDPKKIYAYGTGCIACPFASTFTTDDFSGFSTCVCNDPSASLPYLIGPSSTCQCPLGLAITSQGYCGCAANTYGQYDESYGGISCQTCGNNTVSPIGSTDVSQCVCAPATFTDPNNAGACIPCGTGTDPDGSGCVCINPAQILDFNNDCQTPCAANTYGAPGSCTSCPKYSTSPSHSTDESDCTCQGATFQDPNSSACLPCGTGSDPNGSGCVCLDPATGLDANNNCQPLCTDNTIGTPGSCESCPQFSTSTDGMNCYCTEGNTEDIGGDGDPFPTCGCGSGDGLVWTANGCEMCPSQGGYWQQDGDYGCYCDDPTAYYDSAQNVCQCPAAEFMDPNSANCLPCGTGTDPNAVGCVCLVSTDALDANNNCQVSGSQAALAPGRKAKRARALVLQSLKTTPWQELGDEVLCPRGETACPVLPSMTSYECIDTSSELESCGGCQSLGKGMDCLSVAGVLSATCIDGVCEALSCTRGWDFALGSSSSASRCVKRRAGARKGFGM